MTDHKHQGPMNQREAGLRLVDERIRQPTGPIRKRRVIYIAGYDPRGPEEAARRILAREIFRMGARTGIEATVSDIEYVNEHHQAHWQINAHGLDDKGHPWRVDTEVLYLRWDDLIREDFQRPYVRRLVRSLSTLIDGVASGAVFRMARHTHSTLFLWLYPPLAVLALLTLGIVCGTALQSITLTTTALGEPLSGIVGVAGLLAVLSLGRFALNLGYWGHLIELWGFCRDYALGTLPDVEDRVESFARTIAEYARRTDVDETVVFGHSLGGLLATQAVGSALTHAPDPFQAGAPVALVNVASCAGTSLLRHVSDETRAHFQALAMSHDLLWLEVQGKQDLINYYRADPLKMAGLEHNEDAPNPTIRTINLKDLLQPATYRRVRKDFFRNHHQTIMANDHHHAWEFPRAICGPNAFASITHDIVLKQFYLLGLVDTIQGGKTSEPMKDASYEYDQ